MDTLVWPYVGVIATDVTVTCFLAGLNLAHSGSVSSSILRIGGQATTRRTHTMNSEAGELRGHQSGTKALSSAVTHVAMVRKRFPDWEEEISRLALSNETFRDMCEEYGLAVEALDLLQQRNHPQDVDRLYEYRALIRQMERDLKYELLAAHNPDRAGKS
jgi:hypothetical protein